MTRIEEIEATIVALQEELRELKSAERTAKINEITEMLTSASIQQVDHVLNYLRIENVQNAVAQAVASQEAVTEPEVIITPAGVPITYAESTTPTSINPANVEDYLVDGHIPWSDATISVVGLSHQEMWTVDHDSPQIGDRVKLYPPQRQDGRIVRSILAHTIEDEPRAIGILPQSDSKVEELEAIGAPVVKNRDAYADEAMRNGKMATVVGVVPGKYCFLKLDKEELAPSTPEPTIPEGVEHILQGLAVDMSEARRLFNEQKRDWWAFAGIEEDGRWFKINYLDHRCNSNDWMKAVAVGKAE